MLILDPEKRPTAASLLDMKYFASVKHIYDMPCLWSMMPKDLPCEEKLTEKEKIMNIDASTYLISAEKIYDICFNHKISFQLYFQTMTLFNAYVKINKNHIDDVLLVCSAIAGKLYLRRRLFKEEYEELSSMNIEELEALEEQDSIRATLSDTNVYNLGLLYS